MIEFIPCSPVFFSQTVELTIQHDAASAHDCHPLFRRPARRQTGRLTQPSQRFPSKGSALHKRNRHLSGWTCSRPSRHSLAVRRSRRSHNPPRCDTPCLSSAHPSSIAAPGTISAHRRRSSSVSTPPRSASPSTRSEPRSAMRPLMAGVSADPAHTPPHATR